MNRTAPLTFGRYLVGAGFVIAVLFTVLAPSSSTGLGPLERFLYWMLHAYGALAGLALSQALVSRTGFLRQFLQRRPWLAILAAGALGAWLFAPLALGLEHLLDLAPEPDGDPLDDWATRWGVLGALAAEGLELTAPVCATWLALNIPWLLRLDFTGPVRPIDAPGAEPDQRPTSLETDEAAIGTDSPKPSIVEPAAAGNSPVPEPKDPPDMTPSATEPAIDTSTEPALTGGLLDQLPAALGRDLVALSSQLHYLEVLTDRGRMLVLYNLRDAVQELDGVIAGLQIHRSHWVADAHVRRLVKRGSGWVCELTTAHELPVSRRRVAVAKQRWGAGVSYRRNDAA